MQQALIATPTCYTPESVVALGECLRWTRKVRPIPVLYVYLGAQHWLESMEAYGFVVKSRSMELSWEAYLEDGQGTDEPGSTCLDRTGGAYRGFDVKMEEVYPAQRGTIQPTVKRTQRYHHPWPASQSDRNTRIIDMAARSRAKGDVKYIPVIVPAK